MMVERRTLVLSVDRDDDIGFKASIESPVIGREACLNAATSLGLADPEDSDVNAIFQAIKTYDELKAAGEEVEVAVVSGNHLHMIEGDRRIAEHLQEVIKKTGVTSCVVVADGAEDEFVIPIIQSKIPVSSIRRVIVSQIPNLEGTYYIIKKLLNDPKFSRIILVPIGLALLLYAGANIFGYPQIATIIVLGVIGLYLLYRGIGIDDMLRGFVNALRISLKRARFSFVTYSAGILLLIIGIVLGLMSILEHYTSDGSFGPLLYILTFVYGAVLWITLGGVVASIGIVVDNFFYEREGLVRVIVFPFFISAIGLIAYGASTYVLSISNITDFPYTTDTALRYIFYGILGGLACAIAGVVVQRYINRRIMENLSGEGTDARA
jgi:putative membrane protein